MYDRFRSCMPSSLVSSDCRCQWSIARYSMAEPLANVGSLGQDIFVGCSGDVCIWQNMRLIWGANIDKRSDDYKTTQDSDPLVFCSLYVRFWKKECYSPRYVCQSRKGALRQKLTKKENRLFPAISFRIVRNSHYAKRFFAKGMKGKAYVDTQQHKCFSLILERSPWFTVAPSM